MLLGQLEKLRHFVGVLNSRSIRKYANENGLSQPAISKAMQNLEEAIGVPLMNRDRDGITPTQNGKLLFDFAEQFLEQARETERKLVSGDQVVITGEMKLGAYSSISVYFLPRFYDFLLREQPGLKLTVASAPSAELVREVRAGRLDCIISIEPPRSAELYSIALFTDTYSLFRRTGSNLSPQTDLIFTFPSARDRNGKTIAEYAREARVEGRISACSDFETVKAMVENGVGLAILPNRVAEIPARANKIEAVAKIRGLVDFGEHAIVFSCKRNRRSNASLTWIANQLSRLLSR